MPFNDGASFKLAGFARGLVAEPTDPPLFATDFDGLDPLLPLADAPADDVPDGPESELELLEHAARLTSPADKAVE